jgi:hypothetical protein
VLPRLDDKTVAGGSDENVLFSTALRKASDDRSVGGFDGLVEQEQ